MKKNSQDYCYEKAAQPTAGLYYSLRKIPVEKRDLVVAVHAFYREIEDVIFECHEPELALVKLNWWRIELTKPSHHPVLVVLQNALSSSQRLEKIIDGFQQMIIPSSFETFEDVVIQWMRTAGERELLINDILNVDKIISNEIIYQLMLVIEIVNYIQHLHRYMHHHAIYFAQDEMKRFAVTEDMLNVYVTTDAIKNLLRYQVEKVERAQAVINTLSREQRTALRYLLVCSEMAQATLRVIQESDFKVLENFISLTPLRYWWIGFKF